MKNLKKLIALLLCIIAVVSLVACNKAEEYGSDLVMSGVIFVDGNIFSSKGERTIKKYFEEDTHFEREEELKRLRMGIIGSTPKDADDSRYGMSIWKNLFKNEIIRENNITFESEREKLSEDALFMVDYIGCINKAIGMSADIFMGVKYIVEKDHYVTFGIGMPIGLYDFQGGLRNGKSFEGYSIMLGFGI